MSIKFGTEVPLAATLRLTPAQLTRLEAAGWVPGSGALEEWMVQRAEAAANDPYDKVRTEIPHIGCTAGDAVRRVVACAAAGAFRRAPRWSFVGERLSHGSGVSAALCRACGLDPDELVGWTGHDDDDDAATYLPSTSRLERWAP